MGLSAGGRQQCAVVDPPSPEAPQGRKDQWSWHLKERSQLPAGIKHNDGQVP